MGLGQSSPKFETGAESARTDQAALTSQPIPSSDLMKPGATPFIHPHSMDSIQPPRSHATEITIIIIAFVVLVIVVVVAVVYTKKMDKEHHT